MRARSRPLPSRAPWSPNQLLDQVLGSPLSLPRLHARYQDLGKRCHRLRSREGGRHCLLQLRRLLLQWGHWLAQLPHNSGGHLVVCLRDSHVDLAASHPPHDILCKALGRARSCGACSGPALPLVFATAADWACRMGALQPAAQALRVEGVTAGAASAPQFLAVRKVREADSAGGVLPDLLTPRKALGHKASQVHLFLARWPPAEAGCHASREAL
mmetsp:Transcript_14889/g.33819  ORF Transcript_14889/g.33819 Transcript_14889/m.33819 type:complete len:215 (+) Transcript_14889:50-694(+)